jgi:hypothetical protein
MKSMDEIIGFKKTMDIIKYMHQNPGKNIEEITAECRVSAATFYRHRIVAKNVLQIDIKNKKSKYVISNYGIVRKSKL